MRSMPSTEKKARVRMLPGECVPYLCPQLPLPGNEKPKSKLQCAFNLTLVISRIKA